MAHGKRAAAISDILATSPALPSGSGVSTQSEEDQRRLVGEASEQTLCALINGDNDHLTPPVPAHQFYMTREPNPQDMEDTCSEYDNVGSDVEQDCDEVLHLNREAVGDARFYKPVCPEDGGYGKHTAGDDIKEGSRAVDRLAPRSRPSTETFKGLQSGVKPHKGSHSFRPYCAPARDEAQRGVAKGHENRFLFSDGDEIEEVLDGARFIEDLEETESSALTKTRLCQDNEKDRIRKRGDDPRVTRKKNLPGVCKKRELSHVDSKERHGKGRGRRGTGEDTERVASAVKGSTTCSADQRPKTSSKDSRRGSVRSKARSSKQHPPPSPRRGPSPANTQKAPQHEMPPVPEPTPSSAASPDSDPRVVRAAQSHQHVPERQAEPREDAQKEPEKVQQQEEKCSAERPPEQNREIVPAEETDALKETQQAAAFPSFEDGPCEPEDLIDGIIFAANYLGCTQVLSDKNPSKSVRMSQAQEAVSQIKSQDEDSQIMTEVDLFISTKAVKVLNADTQESMMDSTLRTISYIADIGSIVVLMARRHAPEASPEDFPECPDSASEATGQHTMICYVFESEDAQLIAQSIGQAFSVAYREFLRANGINPTELSQKQYSDIINSQEMYHDDLVHFSNSDNCKEVYVEKQKGESLGVVIVESGWGSILPTVILAGMLNSGPAARSGKLSVGDQIMSINDTSLVGLPLATCQGIIKGLKNQVKVKLSIVSCPPVTTVLIKRPDFKFQLGFSVQNGIICSLMRGGIAERGGVRVGHRIIEINGQSVVAMAHEKIVQTLSVSVGEINMKTMPAVMFRLLTGQETPLYI
ncbi:amyloid-beta A4 precursor protein-binding family A member 2 isoform X3 [Takifugu rubripes]|uniref:amyloid-beta A4 precursor protein-binding family A member 2 isoform X3 n=1 Tax=Takifugu rubripes TaxID=31033 RepID=UPI0011455D01|nr:amyloid-beta A4 precursor protein-binding family A member 2-like isoform X3 [Takifugu rubripes]